jgi:hypothetical protein
MPGNSSVSPGRKLRWLHPHRPDDGGGESSPTTSSAKLELAVLDALIHAGEVVAQGLKAGDTVKRVLEDDVLGVESVDEVEVSRRRAGSSTVLKRSSALRMVLPSSESGAAGAGMNRIGLGVRRAFRGSFVQFQQAASRSSPRSCARRRLPAASRRTRHAHCPVLHCPENLRWPGHRGRRSPRCASLPRGCRRACPHRWFREMIRGAQPRIVGTSSTLHRGLRLGQAQQPAVDVELGPLHVADEQEDRRACEVFRV